LLKSIISVLIKKNKERTFYKRKLYENVFKIIGKFIRSCPNKKLFSFSFLISFLRQFLKFLRGYNIFLNIDKKLYYKIFNKTYKMQVLKKLYFKGFEVPLEVKENDETYFI